MIRFATRRYCGLLRLWILITIALSVQPAQAEIIHTEKSLYHDIYISEDSSRRCMQFQGEKSRMGHYQGCVYHQSEGMVFFYTKAVMATLFLKPNPARILVIGLGVGIVPKAFHRSAPGALIEVVEIDPAVVSLARHYFNWPATHPFLKTYTADGRIFVKQAIRQAIDYDIILIDAFTSEYVPEHMMTREFLQEVKQILSSDGVVAANTFSRSQLYDHESVTYQTVFGDFFNMKMQSSGNRVIVGAANSLPPVDFIRANAVRYASQFWEYHQVHVNDLLSSMESEKDWDPAARILTDQYSPANILAGRGRLKSSWMNELASGLEMLLDEKPVITTVGFVLITIGVLFSLIKFLDFIAALRQRKTFYRN